jgi:site-specific DNA-methyltransferase (adenine-specific)
MSSLPEELQYEAGETIITKIKVGERFREEYGDIEGLTESFDIVGLIQPLAVKRLEGDELYDYELAAGGRRFFALAKKGITKIPIRIYPPSISDETLRLVERIENVCRKDFEWTELAKLDDEIHSIQIAKHGPKISTAKDAKGWSQKDTAKMMNKSEAAISESLKMARLIEEHPELAAKAKTAADARKLVAALEKQKTSAATAAKIESHQNSIGIDAVRKQLAQSYMIGDAIEGMSKFGDKVFDLIEIDPPYGIDLKETLASDGRLSNALDYNEVRAEVYAKFMDNVIREASRIMKPDSWILIWHSLEWMPMLLETMERHNIHPRKIPAIWDKSKGSIWAPNPTKLLGTATEFMLYGWKGNAKLNKPGRHNVFSYTSPTSSARIHPTERPVGLLQDILGTFTAPGSIILSPFLGSGNTILAASNAGMTCCGFDLSKPYRDGYIIRVMEGAPGNYGKEKQEKTSKKSGQQE